MSPVCLGLFPLDNAFQDRDCMIPGTRYLLTAVSSCPALALQQFLWILQSYRVSQWFWHLNQGWKWWRTVFRLCVRSYGEQYNPVSCIPRVLQSVLRALHSTLLQYLASYTLLSCILHPVRIMYYSCTVVSTYVLVLRSTVYTNNKVSTRYS